MRPAVAAVGRAVVLAGAVAAAGGTLDCEGAGVWQASRGGCASGGRSGGGGSVEALGRRRDLGAGARQAA